MLKKWTCVPTGAEWLCVRPPFSFFFDLVGKFWKCKDGNSLALHRICTLARKNGVAYAAIECALAFKDVEDEISSLDASFGGGGCADAVQISFFSASGNIDSVHEAHSDSLIGQLILINYRSNQNVEYTSSYVFEAVLKSKIIVEPDWFTTRPGMYRRTCYTREFLVSGFYYCQQNGKTHVCAHACIRMTVNTTLPAEHAIYPTRINEFLHHSTPGEGLTLEKIKNVLEEEAKLGVDIINCENLDSKYYLSTLSSIVKSGDIALLVLSTSAAEDHVIAVFGCSVNPDEWHPEAIPAYSGHSSAHYYSSSSWITHYLMHDDNFGPNYTLNGRELQTSGNLKPRYLLAVRSTHPTVPPYCAELVASFMLTSALSELAAQIQNPWLNYMRHEGTLTRPVLRTILTTKEKYTSHLRNAEAHDGSKLSSEQIFLLDSLPSHFWMVEFSLPALFTGNRSKLGEVLLHAQPTLPISELKDLLIAVRLPGSWIIRQTQTEMRIHPFDLSSHSPLYRAV